MPLTKVSAGVIAANAVQDSVGSQSITGDKLGLTAINANNIVNASITGAKIATGQITGNLLTANCVSGNNIVSGLALTGNVSVTGNVTVGSTIGVGGATPSTSGAGITFPATASSSSNANTLDDYEEGTWTPTVTPSSGSLTAYTSSGVYVKVGRLVTITGDFQLTTVGTAAGSVSVGGVPFSGTSPSTAYRIAMGSGREDNATGDFYQAVLGGGGNDIRLATITNANITWTNGYGYIFTITYQASA